MIRKNGESLFIAFRHGSVNRIEMDIIDNVKELLNDPNINKLSLKEILKSKIQKNVDGWGGGVNNSSIWYKMIDELNNEIHVKNFDSEILIDVFKIIVENKTEKTIWIKLREFLLKNIEKISGWGNYGKLSGSKLIANIERCNDGSYIGDLDGEQVIVSGCKTDREEKYDYIVKSLLDEYGYIKLLLKFVSVIMITINYKKKPSEYPEAINIYLGENSSWDTWFLHWNWHINRPFGYMPMGWRPQNVLCDSEWLAGDLLSQYCKKSKILIPNEPLFEKPKNELIEAYRENFSGPERFQLACVIDTDLCLSSDGEKYIEFNGMKIRWIDPTSYRKAVIVTPIFNVSNKNEIDSKLELINQFISSMVFSYELPIVLITYVGGRASYTPMTGATRGVSCFMHTGPRTIIDNTDNKKIKLMMSFYKEAINSSSIYYKVLNFAKIIETYAKVPDEQIRLINENIELLKNKNYEARISEILKSNDDFGRYIYESCRCAVAHAGKKSNISPDNIEDYNRMIMDEPLIKHLAREIIIRKSKNIKMLSKKGQFFSFFSRVKYIVKSIYNYLISRIK